MTMADARARIPRLCVVEHKPDDDAALLMCLLEDFDRFTPSIALDSPDGLMLDVTGCVHLFGGEAGLVQAVQTRAQRRGLAVRLAMASTPHAARALARFGSGHLVEPDRERAALRHLPVAALQLKDQDEQALRRAGLKKLADLDDRPRAPFAARFGRDFPDRLARILGEQDIRISPFRCSAPFVADRILLEPISTSEDIERVLSDLLVDVADQLDQRGQGGRSFEAAFYRIDGLTRRVVVQTSRPLRDVSTISRLFRERMAVLSNPLDPGFGFDQMRLSILSSQPLAPAQQGFSGDTRDTDTLDHLIDRLTARLGPGSVLRLEIVDSHIPEKSARFVSAAGFHARSWPDLDPENPPSRPLQIFDPPQPVETMAEVPDGCPLRFRWRRVQHEVVHAEGPERISAEWWLNCDRTTRDYYRVEDREGRRFWLFRKGLYAETSNPRWYIHGLFA